MSEFGGKVQVVIFGKLFLGQNARHVCDDKFEVDVPGFGTILIRRDVNYTSNVPVPFAPMTNRGLRWAANHALNGLDQAEFDLTLIRRSPRHPLHNI